MAREYDTPRTVSLEINVRLAALGRKPAGYLPAAVYAFARSGQLIDKLVLRTSGCARLNLPDLRVMQEVRVMVGPDAPAQHSTVAELSRRGAKEQFVRVSPAIEPPTAGVRYRTVPALDMGAAVCGARRSTQKRRGLACAHRHPIGEAAVQIWEIEPVELMIAKLPDTIIDDFRELLLEAAGMQARLRNACAGATNVVASRTIAFRQTAGRRSHAGPESHDAFRNVGAAGARIHGEGYVTISCRRRPRCACCCVCSTRPGSAST